MRRVPVFLKASFLLGTLSAFGTHPVSAGQRDDSDLRAAVIYNIIRFTDLGLPSKKDVVLCVPNDAPIAKHILAYHGRQVSGCRLSVKLLPPFTYPSSCRVAFMGDPADDTHISKVPQGILLIGEGSNFIRNGGGIALVRLGSQISFEINLKASNEAGVRFSSHLLPLARNVRG